MLEIRCSRWDGMGDRMGLWIRIKVEGGMVMGRDGMGWYIKSRVPVKDCRQGDG